MSGHWVEEAIAIARREDSDAGLRDAAKALADEIDRIHGLLDRCLNAAAGWRAAPRELREEEESELRYDAEQEGARTDEEHRLYRVGLRHARYECGGRIESLLREFK